MIHWTRQIKEVLSAQDALQTSENAGPLEEIEFWKNRCADLSGISDQLDKTGVKRITMILEQAKSSYVAAFLRLSGQIKVCLQMLFYCWTSVVDSGPNINRSLGSCQFRKCYTCYLWPNYKTQPSNQAWRLVIDRDFLPYPPWKITILK